MRDAKANAEQAAAILNELLAQASTNRDLRWRIEQVVALYRSASSVLGRDEADRITQDLRKQLEVFAGDPHFGTLAANALKQLGWDLSHR